MTHKWARVMTSAREGVRIPVPHEFVTVLLNFTHKQGVENPDMLRVPPVESVVPFESSKQAPPQAHKVAA